MATTEAITNGHPKPSVPFIGSALTSSSLSSASLPSTTSSSSSVAPFVLKSGLAQMLKGGVIMDVTSAAEAKIAEEAGAVAVMALDRIPSDIRKEGGVARMCSVKTIKEVQAAVTIPIMAKCRIGHFVEAEILQTLKVDFIDESEVLTTADPNHHVNKQTFSIPFVNGACALGEALRRIEEGAAMIRTKGEAGTGNVVEAVKHARQLMNEIGQLKSLSPEQLFHAAKVLGASYSLVKMTAEMGRLPVVTFSAGGIATPADAALMMKLGVDGVFVGSGIFKSSDPKRMAKAIVKAVAHFNDPIMVAEAQEEAADAMKGLEILQGKIEMFSLRNTN